MKIYNIYLKKDSDNPVESVKVLREGGFHIWAGILHVIWALFHRMWFLAAILFIMMATMAYIGTLNVLAYEGVIFMRIGFFAWVGFTANDWLAKNMEKKGYILTDVVSAETVFEAQKKYSESCTQT